MPIWNMFSPAQASAEVFSAPAKSPNISALPTTTGGRFYVNLVQSIITGTYNISESLNEHRAANYWFGLSTGVVDVAVQNIPYQTRKLLSFFKSAVINGNLDPFSGELHFADGRIVNEQKKTDKSIPILPERMKSGDILGMKEFLDNIIEI